MMKINAASEINNIAAFLKSTVNKTGLKKVVIGWSGGIDSTVCLNLLCMVLPVKDIHVLHMPYMTEYMDEFTALNSRLLIPKENIRLTPIKYAVDAVWNNTGEKVADKIRIGNIMARVRMIFLFDYAKKINGLVCGTENRSEHLLGYFTRHGDGASDIEPIMHLYKTQVYELAKQLQVPTSITDKSPSADLWEGQTDESDFGFSYAQADEVLHLYYDREIKTDRIDKKKYPDAERIIDLSLRNSFKHKVPYRIKP